VATLTSYLTPGPFQPGTSVDRRTTYRAPGPLQPQLTVTVTASAAITLSNLTIAGRATATAASTLATLTATLASLTTASTATATAPDASSASLSATLASLTTSATATATAPASSTATAAISLSDALLVASGVCIKPTSTGTLTATLGALSGSGTAVFVALPRTFEESLLADLNTITALTALTGSRIYEGLIPEKAALPAVVYMTSAEYSQPHLGGQSNTRDESFHLDLIAPTKATARAMLDAVQARYVYADFRGQLGNGVYVAETILESVDSEDMRLSDGTDRPVRVATIAMTMRYSQL